MQGTKFPEITIDWIVSNKRKQLSTIINYPYHLSNWTLGVYQMYEKSFGHTL